VQLRLPGGQTSIALVTWFEDMPPGSLRGLVIGVSRLESTVDELKRRGLEFTAPIEEQPGGRFAYFQDPDGNSWMLNEPAERS
jgi:uncharacterized glyoxalase superfamily protein PhnB